MSLLKGFGFDAYVVCGRVDEKVANMDTSSERPDQLGETEVVFK